MATASGADVIPLRKETKARLSQLKGERTYDEVVRVLLDRTERAAPPSPSGEARHPDEQLALAELAAERWRLWEASGRVRTLGPRLVSYKPREAGREVRLGGIRRGFPP